MSLKYSIKGQIISVILTHLEIVALSFVMWLFTISITLLKMGEMIYSIVAAIAYFVCMYLKCFSQAKDDKKSFSPLTPKPFKGLLLSTGITIVNVVIFLIHISVLNFAGENPSDFLSTASNVVYLFWFSPFINLIDSQSVAISELVMILIMPLSSCFLGYLAGYKNFDISAKLRAIMYEKSGS